MSRIAKFFLLLVAPILAMLLALLGVKTLPGNPLGWFLLLVSVVYIAGVAIVYAIRKERFWEPPLNEAPTHEERGDRSLWFTTLGMLAVFYLSPMEYIYLPTRLPRNAWMSFSGVGLVAVGVVLFVWARRALGKSYSGHVSVKTGQTLVKSGPYRFIRHPAYAGYLFMALGISLGYSSLAGLGSTFVLLLPSLIYRMKVEERFLTRHFGEAYRQYTGVVKRIIPGIW
ncbi:MAG: isoprenylcysteine carboxylmethyltransferase family protein [Anaerolineaceae bacterium]|nr:isoprenylcysteine carboxylmethyltransferase family protein [Anaerolineaceae bacterium]